MDNLNLITSDFVFSGNFDGCLPQKVGVSAPVLKKRSCGDSPRREEGWIGCIAGQKRTDFSSSSSSEWKSRISRAAILCYGCSHNGHQIDKVIIVEHIDPGNEPAGIIDQGNDIAPVFFTSESVRRGPALLSPHQTSLI